VGVVVFQPSELGTLCLQLIPERFPLDKFVVNRAENPIVRFPAAHFEVGDLEISDDVDELTVSIGDITHVHFDCFETDWDIGRRRLAIVDDVSHFVREVLAEEVELFKTWYGGGSAPRGKGSGQVFVWSGPLQDERKGRRWRIPFGFS
jgi:hypothetical protein